jgi:hypothetical protein
MLENHMCLAGMFYLEEKWLRGRAAFGSAGGLLPPRTSCQRERIAAKTRGSGVPVASRHYFRDVVDLRLCDVKYGLR